MRILHVADTHLGTRQYGLEARRRDFAAAFAQVVDLALEHEVDAVVHAGDLFNERNPDLVDLAEVTRQLDRLRAGGVPFLGVVGNHESKREHQWLDFFQELGLARHLRPDVPFELEGVPFWGLDFAGRRAEEVHPPRVEGGVLVMHQLLDEAAPRGELALAELEGCGARWVLLGDFHEHRVWRRGEVLVSYCGSTERWQAAERARRGCTLLEWSSGTLRRLELRTRPFVYLSGGADPLKELAAHARRLAGAVVVIELDEATPSPRQLEEEGQRHGALHVIVRRRRDGEEAEGTAVPVFEQLHVEQLDSVLSRAVAQAELSPIARTLDGIVRDGTVPDSRVGDRVEQVLGEAGL